MNKADFSKDEREEIETSTAIYDYINPIIAEKVKDKRTFQKILNITKEFMSKNDSKLSTAILGRQVIVNSKMEDDIFDTFDLDRTDLLNTCENSPYFKSYGKNLQLMNQFIVALPLIIASLEYKRLGEKEQSDLCYLLTFFKPYASRISVFFKYGVNEDQMLYTVENLSERFDLKKLGTVLGVIKKISDGSYQNYIADIKANEKITDEKLHIIYQSGITSRINNSVGLIVKEYIKNTGKSLSFEDSAAKTIDKDNDDFDFEDADIASDEEVKQAVVNKTITKITKDPVDEKLIAIATSSGFPGVTNSNGMTNQYSQILSSIVSEVTDKMFKELPTFFSELVSSFLFHINPRTGIKYNINDFKSPVFLYVGVDILVGKKSNLNDKNMINARKLFNKMLDEHSIEYLNFGMTYKRYLRRALASYWVYLMKSAN